jgi:hypothetical protein
MFGPLARQYKAALAARLHPSHRLLPLFPQRGGRSAGWRTLISSAPRGAGASGGTRTPPGAPPRLFARPRKVWLTPRTAFPRRGPCGLAPLASSSQSGPSAARAGFRGCPGAWLRATPAGTALRSIFGPSPETPSGERGGAEDNPTGPGVNPAGENKLEEIVSPSSRAVRFCEISPRHSGARRRREPGIHIHGLRLWIPGSSLRSDPE